MLYDVRIDEMIGKHVAEFQLEQSLAKTMGECLRRFRPMPYGYPLRVWSPHHIGRFPQPTRVRSRPKDRLTNGVPARLQLRLKDGYPLGLCNPHADSRVVAPLCRRGPTVSWPLLR